MLDNKNSLVAALIKKGVKIPNPHSVEIGEDVNISQISSDNVTIHSGCKIFGNKTLIMSGVSLGNRAPVSIKNCQIGKDVDLKGGYFEESTFLDSANMGSGAEVREGCLLEEEANGAHNVGLKQTILLPFVTLGSIVNFCDILMAGGTSRSDHSEVGSSYIHFNYTPNQDKATASLVGDVPRGVMLNQPPIFLGGQGGLVGPSQIGYSTVIGAGVVFRGDCPEGNKLIMGKSTQKGDMDFYPGLYWNVKRRVLNSIEYIANIIALKQWYLNMRVKFYSKNEMEQLLYEGALEKLDMVFNERVKRFKALANKMKKSLELSNRVMKDPSFTLLIKQKSELLENIDKIEACFSEGLDFSGNEEYKEKFIKIVDHIIEKDKKEYLVVIKSLNKKDKEKGTLWLLSIIENLKTSVLRHLPSFS